MGGEGSMQSMITMLRNNKKLLRRKSIFRKERSFLNTKKEYYNAVKGEFDFKKISKKELELIRDRITKKRKKEDLRAWLISLTVMIPIIWFGVYIFNELTSGINEQNLSDQQILYNQKLTDFYFFIEDGDNWIEKSHWNNAIFQYKNAVEIFPKEFEGNYRLALAYSYNCKLVGKDCINGITLVNRLFKLSPNNKDLVKLKEVFDVNIITISNN